MALDINDALIVFLLLWPYSCVAVVWLDSTAISGWRRFGNVVIGKIVDAIHWKLGHLAISADDTADNDNDGNFNEA